MPLLPYRDVRALEPVVGGSEDDVRAYQHVIAESDAATAGSIDVDVRIERNVAAYVDPAPLRGEERA